MVETEVPLGFQFTACQKAEFSLFSTFSASNELNSNDRNGSTLLISKGSLVCNNGRRRILG